MDQLNPLKYFLKEEHYLNTTEHIYGTYILGSINKNIDMSIQNCILEKDERESASADILHCFSVFSLLCKLPALSVTINSLFFFFFFFPLIQIIIFSS